MSMNDRGENYLLIGIALAGMWFLPKAGTADSHHEPAQPPWNVRLVGQIGGVCNAVDVVGRYAYVAEGPNLRVLDISSPSAPVSVSNLWLGDFRIFHLRVKNGLAYVVGWAEAGFHGLRIVDVSEPRSPRLRGSLPTPYPALGVCVTNGLAYVGYGDIYDGSFQAHGGVRIIDVTNPTSPTLRGSFDTGALPWRSAVSGGIAYVATDGGLYIYDVTSPTAVRRLSIATPDFGYCYDVAVSGGLAYSAHLDTFVITDVTSPAAPRQRGRFRGISSPSPRSVCLSGKYAYLADNDTPSVYGRGLAVVDVSNPSSPTMCANLPTSCILTWSVAVSSGTAYLAAGDGGLAIIDVRNPERPALRSTYDTLSGVIDVQVRGKVAYVANGVRGVKTIDVSNPQSPRILGSCRTPYSAYRIAASPPFAYVGGFMGAIWSVYYALHVVDVTTPSLPGMRGSVALPDMPLDVAVSGGTAYVACNFNGLQIVDVSKPSTPKLGVRYDTPGMSSGVFVSGGLAYLADDGYFRIFDVRNPAAPVHRSAILVQWNEDVYVSNGVAHLLCMETFPSRDAYLTFVDVRNPDAPQILSQYRPGDGGAYTEGGVHAADGYVYAVMDNLRILDVRDPTKPVLRGFYPSNFPCKPWVSGDYIYLASYRGLRIFQFTGRVSAAPRWQLYR